jgi:hypothetical protein
MGRKDRRGEAGFGAERIPAGDEGEIVGAAARGAEAIVDLDGRSGFLPCG